MPVETLPVLALMGIRETAEGGGDVEGDGEASDLSAVPGSKGNGWESVRVLVNAGRVGRLLESEGRDWVLGRGMALGRGWWW